LAPDFALNASLDSGSRATIWTESISKQHWNARLVTLCPPAAFLDGVTMEMLINCSTQTEIGHGVYVNIVGGVPSV